MERPLRSGYHSIEDYVEALEEYVIHLELQRNIDRKDLEKAIKQVTGIMAHLEVGRDLLIKA